MIKRNARLCLALAPALAIPFLASLLYFVLLEDDTLARMVYVLAKIFLVVWPLLCAVFLLEVGFPKINLRNREHWHAVPIGLFLGGIIIGVLFGLMRTPLGEVVGLYAEPIRAKAQSLGILKHYVIFALFLSVLHSFMEEYYWRWFVFGQLRRELRLAPALAVAGVGFAAHHTIVVSQFFPLYLALPFGAIIGIAGVLWCVMYEEQKSLAGAWACHMMVDLGVMAIGYKLLMG